MPASDAALLLEASVRLFGARCLLRVCPFRVALRLLGLRVASVAPPAEAAPGRVHVARIRWAVAGAARRQRARCLPQALAAHMMLRRRGIPSRVWLGVRRVPPSTRLEAHAWLDACGRVVTGRSGDGYTALAAFERPFYLSRIGT